MVPSRLGGLGQHQFKIMLACSGINTDPLGQSIVDQTGRYLDPVFRPPPGGGFNASG